MDVSRPQDTSHLLLWPKALGGYSEPERERERDAPRQGIGLARQVQGEVRLQARSTNTVHTIYKIKDTFRSFEVEVCGKSYKHLVSYQL